MTRKQLIGMAVVAGLVCIALVAAHFILPIDASWRTNRILHYVWQALVCLSAAGGGVWALWPRNTGSRRDVARIEAQRRVYAMVAVVIAAVLLLVFSEVRREMVSHAELEASTPPALKMIAEALNRYEADHAGAGPDSIEALAPQYLKPESLMYPLRRGPVAAPAVEGSPPADGAAPEPPSYAMAKEMPGSKSSRPADIRYRVYLRPGCAWASLTAVIDKDGRVEVIADDMVGRFEWQFPSKS